MLEILGISILLVGLIALLINYARSTRDVLKDVGIVNRNVGPAGFEPATKRL